MFSCKNCHVLIIKTQDPEQDPNPRPGPLLEKCWIRIRIKSMRIRNPGLEGHYQLRWAITGISDLKRTKYNFFSDM
jgi:hypothetical protein